MRLNIQELEAHKTVHCYQFREESGMGGNADGFPVKENGLTIIGYPVHYSYGDPNGDRTRVFGVRGRYGTVSSVFSPTLEPSTSVSGTKSRLKSRLARCRLGR